MRKGRFKIGKILKNLRWGMLGVGMLLCNEAASQVAGMSTLGVLDMSKSSRTSGLGMDYLALWDGDFGVGIDNPSLLGERFNNMLSFNYVGLVPGTNMGSVNYGYHKAKVGTFVFGMDFMSYGKFDGYDENEVSIGKFTAADYMLKVGWGMAINDNFSVGVNFKPILSQYESYTALALAVDVAGSYVTDSRQFAATLMARNIGAQLMTFDGTRERLPFELSAALSYKLPKAPFRFFFVATDLQRWNLRYEDPLNPTEHEDPFTGEIIGQSKFVSVIDNIFRHTQFGLELNISKVFYARVGYSYRQTKEMQSEGLTSLNMSGFSYGFGLRIKGIEISYSRNNYHLGQAPNYISITTDLKRFIR